MLDGMKEMPARSFCDMECMIPDNVLSSLQTNCPVTQGHKHNLKNRFELKKTLGEGTYGKVKLAIERTSGRQVAIKYIKKTKIQDEHDLNRIRREIKIMSSLRHPHIVNVYEVFENRDKIILVMECANGGELYDYINNNRLTEKDARRIFRQIVSAIKYCHQNGIVHRDLKLENILLDQNDNAKIADFGLSNYYSHNDVLSTYCGSPLYASPEIVKGKPYHGPEVDCWSLGVVLYTLVYGTMPFDGTDFKKLRNQITNGDYYEPARPSEAAGLIRHLLTVNPAKRATITDIMSHWWVNLGHRVMPDNSPYVPPMVLQPVPCCHNQSLSSSSSESDDGENDSTKPKTVKPLKGILKKPKMIDGMSEVKCNDIKSSDAISVVKENSNPLENQSGASNVFTETADDTVKNSDNDDSEFESQSRKSSDTSASDAVFVSDNVSNKTVFDSHKMPKRGILKRKGKFSTGDSGCDLNEGARLTSTSGATSSRPMDLSEGDSALESPDHFSVDDVLVKDKCDLVQSGAFNFGDEHDSANRNNSSVVSGDSINTTVVPRRRGILKNASKDSDKRLSACSIGSNSSADILDFSYDSGDEGLSLAHYYRSESPKTSIVDYGSEIREVCLQGQASLADDIADMNEEKNVLQKALEICKNL